MLTITKPDDFHVHFRTGQMLKDVAPQTAKVFKRALVMPNVPSIETADQLFNYKNEIINACNDNFTPLMTLKLTDTTSPDIIVESIPYGLTACKIYPIGVTTGSSTGVNDVKNLKDVYKIMSEYGIVLCVHAENPTSFVLNREAEYLGKIEWISKNFPKLKIVIEHITTKIAVSFIKYYSSNVAATITAHHLVITLDDVIGDGIRPHLYCKPVPKTHLDRSALIAAVHRNNGRFFFGSDSAPHLRENKESACGCAGVYSAPILMPLLTEVFGKNIKALQDFTSHYGADFYNLPRNTEQITLINEPWRVPDSYYGIVPFMARQTLTWRVM